MDKNKLIKMLTQIIQQICDREEETLRFEDRKIRFRQFEHLSEKQGEFNVLDVTIEF